MADKYELATCNAYKDASDRSTCLLELGVSNPVQATVSTTNTQQPQPPPVNQDMGWEAVFWVVVVYAVVRILFSLRKKRKESKPQANHLVPTRSVIEFRYRDRRGDITERRIRVTGMKRNGLISGECELRGETRTFYADRIISDIIDIETGEVMSPHDWMSAWHKGR